MPALPDYHVSNNYIIKHALQFSLYIMKKGTYPSVHSLVSRGRGIRTPVSSFGDCHPAAG